MERGASHAASGWPRSPGCCGFRGVLCVRHDFFFPFCFFERTRPVSGMRPPFLIYLSASNNTTPTQRPLLFNAGVTKPAASTPKHSFTQAVYLANSRAWPTRQYGGEANSNLYDILYRRTRPNPVSALLRSIPVSDFASSRWQSYLQSGSFVGQQPELIKWDTVWLG